MIFKTEPSDFKKEIDVVGCYVENDGQFILLRRQSHKANGDTWGMPAGKVDAGESIGKAMSREIFEETGIHIPEGELEYFNSLFVRNEGHDFVYHMFSIQLPDRPKVTINPEEHQDFMWVSPAEARKMALIHDLDECIDIFYRGFDRDRP